MALLSFLIGIWEGNSSKDLNQKNTYMYLSFFITHYSKFLVNLLRLTAYSKSQCFFSQPLLGTQILTNLFKRMGSNSLKNWAWVGMNRLRGHSNSLLRQGLSQPCSERSTMKKMTVFRQRCELCRDADLFWQGRLIIQNTKRTQYSVALFCGEAQELLQSRESCFTVEAARKAFSTTDTKFLVTPAGADLTLSALPTKLPFFRPIRHQGWAVPLWSVRWPSIPGRCYEGTAVCEKGTGLPSRLEWMSRTGYTSSVFRSQQRCCGRDASQGPQNKNIQCHQEQVTAR